MTTSPIAREPSPPRPTGTLGFAQPPARTHVAAPSPSARWDDFRRVLGRAPAAGLSPEQSARDAAEQLVSVTLVQPILAQLRTSDSTPPPWGPGPGERQFRALADAELALKIVRSQRFPLVDRLARDLLDRRA